MCDENVKEACDKPELSVKDLLDKVLSFGCLIVAYAIIEAIGTNTPKGGNSSEAV